MLQPSPQGRIHPEVRVDCVHSGQRIQEVLQSIRDGTAGCIRPWRPCDAPGALTRQEAHFFLHNTEVITLRCPVKQSRNDMSM